MSNAFERKCAQGVFMMYGHTDAAYMSVTVHAMHETDPDMS
jgi:hypothetical protein